MVNEHQYMHKKSKRLEQVWSDDHFLIFNF